MGIMSVIITLTITGSNTGPFNIYSDVDTINPLITNVSKSQLTSGTFKLTNVPSNATIMIVESAGICTTKIELPIDGL